MKTCSRCGIEKNEADFYTDGHSKGRLRSQCKPCIKTSKSKYDKSPEGIAKRKLRLHSVGTRATKKAYQSSYSRTNKGKEVARKARIKYLFDITADEYEQMLKAQNGVCSICHKPNRDGKKLAIDHNHITGKVRGLLCRNCNIGIGFFNDKLELLWNAYQYLVAKN